MRLTFLGGADEVGASSTLVEIAGKRLLIDAGIRISPRSSRGIQKGQLPDLRPISKAGGPDYILVTHAHTDHTGALPLVVEQHPVPVLATAPTVALVRTLQADAQRIMQSRKEQEGELPLFDEVAVDRLLDAFQPVEFGQAVRLGEGLQATFHPAGHILGAALLVLESEEGVLVFTGDFSLSAQRAVTAPQAPRLKADALVTESTYGGKLHADRVAEEKRLVETLEGIIKRGGKALVPAFAIGRAQEVIQIIHAFRDRIDAPVYVDGMVRSVCRTYAAFAELLPENTTYAAGEDNVFFRDKISAVKSAAEREEIARSEQPAVIVASSGMLTGGASVVYAKHLAGGERNAILLTGYQDEESPGRFLQNVMREREENRSVALKLDDTTVTLRCQLETYSLSAHADEAEMVNLAEALEADDVLIVHGDPQARHSLAARLRERNKRVRTPNAGQTHELAYAPRPWAMGKAKRGNQTRKLEPAELWEALKGQAGSFYTAGELARMWWGDETRDDEATTVLVGEGIHFAQDWRERGSFQVRAPEQIERAKRQRAIMAAHPDLVRQVVVLRDTNNRPRVGVVVGASGFGFEAIVRGAKGRHYPGDALLWPVGQHEGSMGEKTLKAQLNALYREAEEIRGTFLSFERREALAEAGQPVHPASLLPANLPEGVTRQIALLGIILALAEDGATLDLEGAGLVPKRVMREGVMEQNKAREFALATIPPEARLRKIGMEIHRKRMTLSFDFPDQAGKTYAEAVEQIEKQTGWDVVVNPSVNQQTLGAAVEELLPPGARLSKGPSFYMDRRQVEVAVDGLEDPQTLADEYRALTGYRLLIKGQAGPAPSAPAVTPPGESDKMEINAAYGLIRLALEPFGLYKVGLKQGQIVLSFISPQVGARHQEIIERLAEQTGYALAIHPHPNQQQIMQVVNRLAREAGWQVVKGLSLHVERLEVELKLIGVPDTAEVEAVGKDIEEQTGYRLVLTE
jgi:Cft2 family RNA processing exonuclease